jgi:hypothetical protein
MRQFKTGLSGFVFVVEAIYEYTIDIQIEFRFFHYSCLCYPSYSKSVGYSNSGVAPFSCCGWFCFHGVAWGPVAAFSRLPGTELPIQV